MHSIWTLIFSTVLLLPFRRVQIKCILFLKCLVWNNHPLDPENFLSNPFLSKKVISVSKLFICFKNHHWTITTKNVTSKSVVTNILRSNFCFPWYSILSNMKICQYKMSETKYKIDINSLRINIFVYQIHGVKVLSSLFYRC